MPGRDRLVYIGGGAALASYGLYVGGQDSGTFFFPAAIFAVPVAAVILAVVKAVESRSAKAQSDRESGG